MRTALAILVLSPYLMSVNPEGDDSTSTFLQFAVGQGSFADVHRDCNGNVRSVRDVPFAEAAVSVTHDISAVRLSVAGGVTGGSKDLAQDYRQGTADPLYYLNPSAGLNFKGFGLELGYAFRLNQPGSPKEHFFTDPSYGYSYYRELYGIRSKPGFPTWMLRFGRLDGFHFSTSCGRNIPLVTGGGLYDIGFGFGTSNPGTRIWLGIGAYPYDGAMFTAKGRFPVSSSFSVLPRVVLGGRESLEYGISVGGEFHF